MPLIKIVKLSYYSGSNYDEDYYADLRKLTEIHSWEEVSVEDLFWLNEWRKLNREYEIIEFIPEVNRKWIDSAKELAAKQKETILKQKQLEEERRIKTLEKKILKETETKKKLLEKLKVELGEV